MEQPQTVYFSFLLCGKVVASASRLDGAANSFAHGGNYMSRVARVFESGYLQLKASGELMLTGFLQARKQGCESYRLLNSF